MDQDCYLCGSRSKIFPQTLKIIKAIDVTSTNNCKRIKCTYYSLAEVNSNAYERFNGSDKCFKEKHSCCHCMHRFYSPEFDDYYCFFDYLDEAKKEMYYLKPLRNSVRRKQIIIRYWVCPVCKAKIELSLKEKHLEVII